MCVCVCVSTVRDDSDDNSPTVQSLIVCVCVCVSTVRDDSDDNSPTV